MSLPPEFATTGLAVSHVGDTPITRFKVLGERSSGTNFVKRLIGRNTDLIPSEALGWKHGVPHMMAVPRDMAVICVVRRADSWAMSMFSKPWHTTPAMQALEFSDFLRAEWDTIIDRQRYFDGLVPDGSVGAPLQQDRAPLTGARFANLFALRRAKLDGLLGIPERDCTCVFLRVEDAQADPEGTLDAIMAGLDHTGKNRVFRPVIKRLGSKFKPAITDRPEAPEAWSDADMVFLRSQIDAEQEATLGYTY
jgi:hypothetical protein